MTAPSALVLGGGGVAGIAWHTGFLLGLQDASAAAAGALLNAGVLLGTSAGAAVAAQISSGVGLAALYARQVSPAHGELRPTVRLEELLVVFEAAARLDRTSALRAVGERALAATTVSEAERRAVIAGRLPAHDWPQRDLRITAIDVLTGELSVFDRRSGVGLVDAVAASCAVPCIWPTVAIGGRRYMDGGVGSSVNVGVVADAATVVMLAPTLEPGLSPVGPSVVDEAAALTGRVLSVFADAASVAAFGRDPLDPDSRIPSAQAGRAQGRRQAAEIASFLGV